MRIECKSETGITIGLIDSLIVTCNVLAERLRLGVWEDTPLPTIPILPPRAIRNALLDLICQPDVKFVLNRYGEIVRHIFRLFPDKQVLQEDGVWQVPPDERPPEWQTYGFEERVGGYLTRIAAPAKPPIVVNLHGESTPARSTVSLDRESCWGKCPVCSFSMRVPTAHSARKDCEWPNFCGGCGAPLAFTGLHRHLAHQFFRRGKATMDWGGYKRGDQLPGCALCGNEEEAHTEIPLVAEGVDE